MVGRKADMIEDSEPILGHFATFDSQIMEDSSQLLSLPSQPPDIKIWFPSYEYESPELDFDDDHIYENFSGWNAEDVERIGNRKDSNTASSCAVKRTTGASTACQRPDEEPVNKDTHLPAIREGLPRPTSILLTRSNEDNSAQDFSLDKCNQILEAGNGNSNVKGEFPQEKVDGKSSMDGGHFVSKTGESSNKDHGNSEEGILAGKDHKEEQVEVERLLSTSSEAEDRSNVEEEGKTVTNDGFRSTKSKKSATENPGMIYASKSISVQASTDNHRKIRENYMSGSRQSKHGQNTGLVLQENKEVPVGERHVQAGRMVLLDRTNFHANEMIPEVTGRWKCPQRGKPYIGPPLKQLRLECWLRRVD